MRRPCMKNPSVLMFIIALLAMSVVSEAAEVVRFAYPAKSLNYLPLILGRHKGFYRAEGIDLELIQVTSMISAKALTTGDLEFSGAQAQVLGAAAKGLPVKIIAFITIKPSFWLVAKSEIRSIADLKRSEERRVGKEC